MKHLIRGTWAQLILTFIYFGCIQMTLVCMHARTSVEKSGLERSQATESGPQIIKMFDTCLRMSAQFSTKVCCSGTIHVVFGVDGAPVW